MSVYRVNNQIIAGEYQILYNILYIIKFYIYSIQFCAQSNVDNEVKYTL